MIRTRSWMRTWVLAVIAAALPAPAAFADDVGDAADAVEKAVKAGDTAALEAAAAKDAPDPWLVADQLLARGASDAAAKFAKAKPRKDTEKLPAYVAARAGKPDDAPARALAVRVNDLINAKKADEALALVAKDPAAGDVNAIVLIGLRGLALNALQRPKDGIAPFLAAGEFAERIGWLTRASALYQSAGLGGYNGGDAAAAVSAWERRVTVERARGPGRALATTYMNLSVVYDQLGRRKECLERTEAEAATWEAAGDKPRMGVALSRAGGVCLRMRDFDGARGRIDRAVTILESAGDAGALASALIQRGDLHRDLAEFAAALSVYQRAIPALRSAGDTHSVGYAQNAIGLAYLSMSQLTEAMAAFESARATWHSDNDPNGECAAIANIAQVHSARGDSASAIAIYEEALALEEKLDERIAAAATMMNLAGLHAAVGDRAGAIELYRKSLAAREAMDDAEGASHVVLNMGSMYMHADDAAQARPLLLDAQKRMEKIHDRHGLIAVHTALARLDITANALAEAQAHTAAARALGVEIDQRDVEPTARQLDGMIAERRGDAAAALAAYRAAAAGYRECEGLSDEIEALAFAAGAELKLGRPKDALATAHTAVAQLGTVVRGLSDTEGAGARSTWTRLYDVGVAAAQAAGDVKEFSFFAESGRAGALLEALRGRDAIQNASLSDELLAAERTARAEETAAARAHEIAVEGKKLGDIARTKKDLAAATARRADVIAKIQREAKAAANVLYPSAAPLDEIRAALGANEALVSYVVAGGKATALVTRKDGAKIVALGDAAAVSAAATALALDDAAADPAAALAKLRALVFDPLGLGADVTRVLVSPDGPLAFVPFATLAGDREVAYVASGTTLTVLAAEAARKGEGVLALGDPVYSKEPAPEVVALNRGAGKLLPLPGTRDEAKAVGTTVLLGEDANETRLASEIATSPRWRAVHLACHGLVNVDQPMQSCLALTKTDDDDGFLTALEVFRMRVPSDLVVLSACETGRGREVRGEGLVGLTRAFMFAGAPRVVVSLWKVDDQATRALMEKFHAAWKAGSPAAKALRDAQTFVRSQEKWKHPAYWAAWVLWGLPQ